VSGSWTGQLEVESLGANNTAEKDDKTLQKRRQTSQDIELLAVERGTL